MTLNTINLPVLISVYNPLTISSGPWSRPRREGKVTLSSVVFFGEHGGAFSKTTHSQWPSWDGNPDVLTRVPVLFLLRQSPGCSSRCLSGLLDQCSAEMDKVGARGAAVGEAGSLGMLRCRCGKQGAKVTAGCSPPPTPHPTPSFLLTGSSCFAVNSSSHGSHIKAEDRRPGRAARGTDTEMNRAAGKRTGEGAEQEWTRGGGTGWERYRAGRNRKALGERWEEAQGGAGGTGGGWGAKLEKTAGWAVLQNLPMYSFSLFRKAPLTPPISKFCLQLLLLFPLITRSSAHKAGTPGWASLSHEHKAPAVLGK